LHLNLLMMCVRVTVYINFLANQFKLSG
jgi:hypothetical protein